MIYESGDDESVDLARHRRGRTQGEEEEEEEAMEEDIPIDTLDNLRDRTIKEHVSDEAVGKEIERR